MVWEPRRHMTENDDRFAADVLPISQTEALAILGADGSVDGPSSDTSKLVLLSDSGNTSRELCTGFALQANQVRPRPRNVGRMIAYDSFNELVYFGSLSGVWVHDLNGLAGNKTLIVAGEVREIAAPPATLDPNDLLVGFDDRAAHITDLRGTPTETTITGLGRTDGICYAPTGSTALGYAACHTAGVFRIDTTASTTNLVAPASSSLGDKKWTVVESRRISGTDWLAIAAVDPTPSEQVSRIEDAESGGTNTFVGCTPDTANIVHEAGSRWLQNAFRLGGAGDSLGDYTGVAAIEWISDDVVYVASDTSGVYRCDNFTAAAASIVWRTENVGLQGTSHADIVRTSWGTAVAMADFDCATIGRTGSAATDPVRGSEPGVAGCRSLSGHKGSPVLGVGSESDYNSGEPRLPTFKVYEGPAAPADASFIGDMSASPWIDSGLDDAVSDHLANREPIRGVITREGRPPAGYGVHDGGPISGYCHEVFVDDLWPTASGLDSVAVSALGDELNWAHQNGYKVRLIGFFGENSPGLGAHFPEHIATRVGTWTHFEDLVGVDSGGVTEKVAYDGDPATPLAVAGQHTTALRTWNTDPTDGIGAVVGEFVDLLRTTKIAYNDGTGFISECYVADHPALCEIDAGGFACRFFPEPSTIGIGQYLEASIDNASPITSPTPSTHGGSKTIYSLELADDAAGRI